MLTALNIIYIILGVLLVLVVMSQESIGAARKSVVSHVGTDREIFLRRATIILIICVAGMSLFLLFLQK